MPKYEKGRIVKGVVSGIESYGIFINLDENYNGLIHISEISEGFVKNPNDFVNVGDTIYTKIIDVNNDTNQVKLSIKSIEYKGRKYRKRKQIIETKTGFKTLAARLPIWIEENLKNYENKNNKFIDQSTNK